MQDKDNPKESVFENRLVRTIERLGGFAPKTVWPGETGAPDRQVFMPDGWNCLVEMKRPKNGKKSKRQIYIHGRLTQLKQNVVTIWTNDQLDDFIDNCKLHQLEKEVI